MQHVDHRSAAVSALGATLVGGTIGWITAFSGLGGWGLMIGLASTVIVIVAFARRTRSHAPFVTLTGFAFAFILLTWPLLWLLVGYIRFAITGESLGDCASPYATPIAASLATCVSIAGVRRSFEAARGRLRLAAPAPAPAALDLSAGSWRTAPRLSQGLVSVNQAQRKSYAGQSLMSRRHAP